MQFDDFYKTIGEFGNYQKVKYFLLCLTNMLPPIMVYTWSFIAATPSFRCRTPFDDSSSFTLTQDLSNPFIPTEAQCRDSQKGISLRECQRCFQIANISNGNGELSTCGSYVFDRTFFQSTLVEEWSMVCDQVSLKSTVQIVFFVGYMVGSIVFGVLSDKFGRRPVMGISFVLMSIAGIVCALAPQDLLGFRISYPLLIVGRFLLACATRGIAVTGFVMGSEIVGSKHRLFAGIVIKYFFAIGQLLLLGFAINIRTWRTLNAVLAIVPVPFIFFYFILPESPRWLISKERYDDAEKILRRMAQRNKTQFDLKAYTRFTDAEKKRAAATADHSSGLVAFFRSKIMAIIALNMSFQWFVQNLVFYGISQSTGSWSKNPYISFGVSALVEIAGYMLVHLILDRWGRKKPYCSFVVAFAVVALLVVPIQTFMRKDSRSQHLLMFIINISLKFLASGSYAIIYIYSNETFPTQGRNTGMGACSMIARVGAIVGTLSNDHLTRTWSHFPTVVYGVTSLLAALLATIFPETLNKPLPQTIEDVEKMGLVFPMGTSKQKKCIHINDIDNADEDVMLEKQLKENVDL